MLRLQTKWESDRLTVWAIESAAGEILSTASLRAALSERCGDPLILVDVPEVPVPLESAAGGALRLDAAQAADFLLQLTTDGIERSPAAETWQALAQFAWQRIAAGQFYPTIEWVNGHAAGVWRVLVSDAPSLQWLQVASRRIQISQQTVNGESDHLVESFLGAVTDALVRRTFAEDPFFATTADRCHRGDATADMRFIGSLLTDDDRIIAVDDATLDVIRSWVDSLQAIPQTAAFRLIFKLDEPADEESDRWPVEFLMEPLHGDGEAIPARHLWEMGQELPPILGRNLSRQRQILIEELHRAAEIWPALQNRLDQRPSTIEITGAETIAMARQWAVKLIDAGYGVRLPKWATQQDNELSIQLSLSPLQDEAGLFQADLGDSGRGPSDPFTIEQTHMGLSSLMRFDWRVAVGARQLSDDQFESILKLGRPLVRFDGQWIHVDTEAARRAAEFMERNRTGQITLAEAMRLAHGTSRAQTGLHISGLSGVDWIGEFLQQMPDAHMQSMQQPADFAGQLRPYQLRGLRWLAFLQRLGIGACLADDMGLGKTIQLIALLLAERQSAREANRPAPGPTLLFAPTSVIGNWSREIERFAPAIRLLIHHGIQRRHGDDFREAVASSDLVITTYALSSRDIDDFRQIPWHRVALDEAQKIKNPSAASTQAIRSLSASYRVALTGTPIENHLSELWSIMEILNPGLLGSAAAFREHFAVPIERIGDRGRAHHLREMIKPFVLRRTKSDPAIAGDLPEKLEMKVFCNLTVEQASLYQRIADEMLGQIDSASGIRRRGLILAALTRLKQVCDHPALLAGKLPGFQAREADLDARSGKCERLIEMLEEVLDEGDSALVFTQFKEMGDLLEILLRRRLNAHVLYLHGGTPAPRRDEMIQQFQDPAGKARIFLLSLRAGGLGLNLTRANHVFHFDRWWNPAVEQQATDRAHRIGQSRTVSVHKYVCIGTMEERIDRMITEKMQLADRIITTGDDWLTSLSTEELRRTLELSANAVEDYSNGDSQ